jgi:hypothetical protein
MSEIEALADAITGGVLGRAVEPKAGESDGHTHEAKCLNCGTLLIGPHCHQCGQHAHVHQSLSAFFHDFAHGVFHLEGKLWRTIPLLVWKPGDLTRRYIAGQRASFVSPIALFLFCVFFMFAVMGWTGMMDTNLGGAKLSQAEQEQASELSKLRIQRADALVHGKSTATIDKHIADAQDSLGTLQSLQKNGLQPALAGGKPTVSSDIPWLNQLIGKAKANPELLFFKLKTNAYKYSWALIPISVPLVWLLFPFNRRFRLYHHTVFVTYSLCFMMLLLSAATVIAVISQNLADFCWLVPPIHMYRQLRGAYGVSALGAVLRTFALTIFAFIAIGLFATLLVGLGGLE